MELSLLMDVIATVVTISGAVGSLSWWLAKRLTLIDKRFEEIDRRFEEINKRFEEVNKRFEEVNKRFDEIRGEIRQLRRDVHNFSGTLLDVLYAKSVLSETELITLRSLLSSILPRSSTKYYTKDVENRLRELLRKEIDEITWDDIFELKRIARLLREEAYESDREDLLEYSWRLHAYVSLLQARLIRKGVLPPRRD